MENTIDRTDNAASKIEDVSALANASPPDAGHAVAPLTMDIQAVMDILPHRYPFLLIDRVVELTPKQRIVALKNVTINESHFQGHFPGYPIMPGVLIVEAMAQAGCILLLKEFADHAEKLIVFTGIEDAKFRRAVVPGDQVRVEVDVLQWSRRGGRMRGNAFVDGKLACAATITCQVVPRQRKATSAAASETSESPVAPAAPGSVE